MEVRRSNTPLGVPMLEKPVLEASDLEDWAIKRDCTNFTSSPRSNFSDQRKRNSLENARGTVGSVTVDAGCNSFKTVCGPTTTTAIAATESITKASSSKRRFQRERSRPDDLLTTIQPFASAVLIRCANNAASTRLRTCNFCKMFVM
jgi:hypothetical protein